MINAQAAVKAALDYLQGLYSRPLEGLDLEEIELSEDGRFWLVTLGFWEPKPRSPLDKDLDKANGGQVLTIPSAQVIRVYKVVKVDAKSGNPLSMKIRESQ